MRLVSLPGLLALMLLGLGGCRQESNWEKTLVGPFSGDVFNGELKSPPISTLPLESGFVLNVHWEPATNSPILVLRNTSGVALWKQVMVPRFKGESNGLITQLSLAEAKRTKDGTRVKILCDWTRGGKEGGVIYLGANREFKSFSLGW